MASCPARRRFAVRCAMYRPPSCGPLSRTIRPLGTWWGIVPGVLLLLAASRHARRRWWLVGLALIVAPLAGEALQELVGRLRPSGPAFGFPSGHATATAAFAVALIYLVGRSDLRTPSPLVIAVVAVTLTLPHRDLPHGPRRPLAARRGRRLRARRGGRRGPAAWWDASHTRA